MLVLSKCVMMFTVSRDNIKFLMDRIKEMVPQGSMDEIYVDRQSGGKEFR